MSRGILHGGGRAIEYYTSQPSSSQWIALGVVPLQIEFDDKDSTHRVVVGTGQTEEGAIAALKQRLDELFAGTTASMPIIDQASLALQPSDWFG